MEDLKSSCIEEAKAGVRWYKFQDGATHWRSFKLNEDHTNLAWAKTDAFEVSKSVEVSGFRRLHVPKSFPFKDAPCATSFPRDKWFLIELEYVREEEKSSKHRKLQLCVKTPAEYERCWVVLETLLCSVTGESFRPPPAQLNYRQKREKGRDNQSTVAVCGNIRRQTSGEAEQPVEVPKKGVPVPPLDCARAAEQKQRLMQAREAKLVMKAAKEKEAQMKEMAKQMMEGAAGRDKVPTGTVVRKPSDVTPGGPPQLNQSAAAVYAQQQRGAAARRGPRGGAAAPAAASEDGDTDSVYSMGVSMRSVTNPGAPLLPPAPEDHRRRIGGMPMPPQHQHGGLYVSTRGREREDLGGTRLLPHRPAVPQSPTGTGGEGMGLGGAAAVARERSGDPPRKPPQPRRARERVLYTVEVMKSFRASREELTMGCFPDLQEGQCSAVE
uniref:Uncharacterized protein n=1 Tax=Chromera velia CCMP2878 TaxID=1169474 RepID=A0A0G4FQR8_9ALVE|eukprot:Cvel_18268.t1-p1 / transcript=Cvel_18268.t1 / gene=Cvel_18268 / organism=Chromera_velia_CCMP2878 / gene_product=hypothetical protein / transcript_product=hypothetical protein / location=Cvel_scaffold1505:474-3068(-) / protein_length=438 / sequence_SO=supercontig / SO=protein_coding / is_pseudo=false